MPVRSVVIALAVLVGVASAWLPTGAQQVGKVYRVGFLTGGTPHVYAGALEAFKLGLRELGEAVSRPRHRLRHLGPHTRSVRGRPLRTSATAAAS